MKNIVRGRGPRLLIALAATALLYACGSGGGSEPPAVVVSPPPIAASQNLRYQIFLTDAATGQQILDPLALTFVGTPQVKAFNGTVLNGTTVTATSGGYAFDTAFTSTAKDLSIQVADPGGKGWVPTGINLSAPPGATGDQTVEVKLVNTKQAAAVTASPAPVAMTVKTVTAAADGSLSAPLSVATTPKTITNTDGVSQTMGVAQVALATGTKVTTKDGAPAAPGPLSVSSTYYSSASSESLAAFPGGFAPTVRVGTNTAVLNGAAADTGAFVTAGFAQFNVTDSAGKAIKNFDPAVTLGIDLPKDTKDPDGNTVTVGSDFPIWSYDETSGAWVFEKMGKVAEKTPVDPTNYTVVFQTNHLSTWALGKLEQSCSGGKITLNGRLAGDQRPLRIVITGAGGGFDKTTDVTDSTVDLTDAPSKTKVNIKVYDGKDKVGQVEGVNLCGAVSIDVQLTPAPTATLEVRTSDACDAAGTVNKRGLSTAVNVRIPDRPLPLTDTTTVTPTTTAYDIAVFNSLPAVTATVQALNPYSNLYESQAVKLTSNTTTVAPFTFVVVPACKTTTGPSSTGG